MVLTATATKSLQYKVATILGMCKPVIFVVSPCKENIMYTVSSYTSLSETFEPVLLRLKKKRTKMPRICVMRFIAIFKNGLGRDFTEPPGYPDHSRFRLVDMFTSCTDAEVKSEII